MVVSTLKNRTTFLCFDPIPACAGQTDTVLRYDTIRYDTTRYDELFVRSKTDMGQLNLPHGTNNKREKLKNKSGYGQK